jgi:hypothetical protein
VEREITEIGKLVREKTDRQTDRLDRQQKRKLIEKEDIQRERGCERTMRE